MCCKFSRLKASVNALLQTGFKNNLKDNKPPSYLNNLNSNNGNRPREIIKGNSPTIRICLDALVNITLVYPMTAAVFFSILCRTASQNIEQIRLKIREIITQNPTNGVNHLQQLKEFYFRNSDFIYQINRYFGVILLLDISSNLIQVVKLIGVFAVGGSNSEAWDLYGMASFFLFLYFTDMVIVTFAVDCIVQEVPTNSYDVINLLRTDN